MQILSPGGAARRRVLVFLPRWLPREHAGPRTSHLMLPVLGALVADGSEVVFAEEAWDGTPDASWAERLCTVDVLVVWCAELYPAHQIAGLRAFVAAAAHAPEVPLAIGGGFLALLDPARLGVPARVAAVVTGPGEVALPPLVAALAARAPLDALEGITFWRGGAAVGTRPARRRALDPSWIEPLRSLDLQRYVVREPQLFNNDAPTLQIHTGSGCAKRCRFCFDERNPYGVFAADTVVEAIAIVRARSGVAQVQLGELDFFHRTERVRAVARGLIERGLGVRWFALGSVVDLLRLDDADLRLLRHSGCWRVEVGSESGSDTVLARLGKRHRAADVLRVVERFRAHGLRTAHNLLFGTPGETRADRRATLRLAARIVGRDPTAHLHARAYQVVPSTTLGDELLATLPAFPRSLDELAGYRHDLQGGGRALPWLSPRDEAWVQRLVRYVVPLAYHDLGGAIRGVWPRALRALARWRSRFDVGALSGLDERWFLRATGARLAGTFVP